MGWVKPCLPLCGWLEEERDSISVGWLRYCWGVVHPCKDSGNQRPYHTRRLLSVVDPPGCCRDKPLSRYCTSWQPEEIWSHLSAHYHTFVATVYCIISCLVYYRSTGGGMGCKPIIVLYVKKGRVSGVSCRISPGQTESPNIALCLYLYFLSTILSNKSQTVQSYTWLQLFNPLFKWGFVPRNMHRIATKMSSAIYVGISLSFNQILHVFSIASQFFKMRARNIQLQEEEKGEKTPKCWCRWP